jgi:hypothetical protein
MSSRPSPRGSETKGDPAGAATLPPPNAPARPGLVPAAAPSSRSSDVDSKTSRAAATANQSPGGSEEPPEPELSASHLALRIACESFEEIQRTRIGIQNRIGATGTDSDALAASFDHLHRAERKLGLYMRRTFRRSFPELAEWQTGTLGVGEHLLARLIAHVGHPVITTRHRWEGEGSERELVSLGLYMRRVSDLWAYCGHGDPARRPRKGMTAEEAAQAGNPQAKMLTHLIAESIIKIRRAPLRAVYDEGRAKYEERDWTDGHRHNAALRLVGKAFLKDLWLAAGGGTYHPLPSHDSGEAVSDAHPNEEAPRPSLSDPAKADSKPVAEPSGLTPSEETPA